jgi:hypothetical protein
LRYFIERHRGKRKDEQQFKDDYVSLNVEGSRCNGSKMYLLIKSMH